MHNVTITLINRFLAALRLCVSIFLISVALGCSVLGAEQPNIVLVFIDDMGYADIGPFGNEVNQTPNLDRMAREGNVLRQFYVSNTACTPSRSALMTGTYAHRIGMDGSVVFPGEKRGLNPKEITIAEMLKEHGYATGCFGKWHLGDQPAFLPLKQGFDEYFGIPYSNDMWPGNNRGNPVTNRGPYEPLPVMRGNEAVAYVSDGADQSLLCEAVTDAAIKFIEDHRDESFFCYVPHAYIHNPRFARPEILQRAEGDTRRANIEEVDDSVGRILAVLRELKLAENTLVIFTSDNGGAEIGPLRGAKGGPKYEGHMREPTLTWWPGTIPAGVETEAIATTTDLLPSFAKLTGATVPSDRTIDGKDVLDILLGRPDATSPHKVLYYETDGIRRGDWKLVRVTAKGRGRVSELYNLKDDVGERNNLAAERPDVVEELEELLAAHAERIAADTRPAAFVEDARPILTEPGDLPRLRELVGKPDVHVGIPEQLSASKPGPRGPLRVDVTPAEYKPADNDILIADFESEDYGQWQVIGEAMGDRPSLAATRKNRASGYLGKGFVNTYLDGDKMTGELTSPPFCIERNYINFLIGGGNHPGRVGIQLLVDGQIVRSATGHSLKNPQNEEIMDWQSLDVAKFIGQQAVLKIIDKHSGGWGHTVVDHIFQSDKPMPSSIPETPAAAKPHATGPAAPAPSINVAEPFPPPKPGVTLKDEWSTFPLYDQVGYDQPLRPQFHFTSRMGWLNDPNGLVYYDGEWHMYFQHVAIRNNTGPKSWGNAVSTDLMHWQQLPHAINPYPNVFGKDELHTIWSGSAVVDVLNGLGRQEGDVKTLFALFTATNPDGFFQGGAYSIDKGRTWTKINGGKPVIPHQVGFSKGQRDPRIFYYEPGEFYVTIMMIGGPERKVRLWKSTNLLDWEVLFDIPNKAAECIDMFHVAVDGDPDNRKCVIADAGSHYEVGDFDGKKWTGFGAEDNEGRRLRFEYGDAWYAAQTFNQGPDGRVVHIGWLRSKQPGYRPFLEANMPFTQQMSIPIEITLRTTLNGIRLFRNPIQEIEQLYSKSTTLEDVSVQDANKRLAELTPELIDMTLRCGVEDFTLNIRGLRIRYQADAREFVFTNTARVEGEKAAWNRPGPYRDDGVRRIPAPPVDGKVTLRALVDRASLELFANDGQAAASFVVVPEVSNRCIRIDGNEELDISSLVINELKSIW